MLLKNIEVAQENEFKKMKASCNDIQSDVRTLHLNTTEDCAIECYKDGLCVSFEYNAEKCVIYYQLCEKLLSSNSNFIYEKKDKRKYL